MYRQLVCARLICLGKHALCMPNKGGILQQRIALLSPAACMERHELCHRHQHLRPGMDDINKMLIFAKGLWVCYYQWLWGLAVVLGGLAWLCCTSCRPCNACPVAAKVADGARRSMPTSYEAVRDICRRATSCYLLRQHSGRHLPGEHSTDCMRGMRQAAPDCLGCLLYTSTQVLALAFWVGCAVLNWLHTLFPLRGVVRGQACLAVMAESVHLNHLAFASHLAFANHLATMYGLI